jgi:hypothetical protein
MPVDKKTPPKQAENEPKQTQQSAARRDSAEEMAAKNKKAMDDVAPQTAKRAGP